MVSLRVGRRQVVAAAAALPFTFIHTGRAAGSLSIAFMSSLVPGCDQKVQRLVESWGEKNNVAVRADFLSAVTNQSLAVPQAEAQARAGHDIIHFLDYNVVGYIDQLELVDDVVARLVASYGPPFPETEYFVKPAGAWRAVPTGMGSLYWPSESRIDLVP